MLALLNPDVCEWKYLRIPISKLNDFNSNVWLFEDRLPTCFDEDKLNNNMIKEGKRKDVEHLISFARCD